ncbi:hypothetical protein [Streptoalloteichus hindustanus]|uniref:Uncharacterized protein n=1 Tax=Streptoalloteichus hindustanus TaxID=2017 RepID=A0A1M5FE51_STRHI|nr:hypothetical protein [Streptoalloteichus hindustanus]SHF89412.1 hypothetical protein SAMN05444320_105384 [Streptoalloteichus hindustanus]
MLLRCVANRGKDLPPGEYGLRAADKVRYPVTVGHTYQVYAMVFFRRALVVLLNDDNSMPRAYPVELFEVVDGEVPDDWTFARRFRDGEFGVTAVLGYSELVADEDHLDLLMDNDREAWRIFFREVRRRSSDVVDRGSAEG